MAKHYDNIEDVKSKLVGTIIYYGGVPVICKNAVEDPETNGFYLHLTKSLMTRGIESVKMDNPELNWIKFNLGYANTEHGAIWWYRQPIRQYKQGLKNDQMNYMVSDRTQNMGFGFSIDRALESMLLDKYPSIDEIEKVLKDGAVPSAAFHRDFALSWDKIHKDMIIEYKGHLIGCTSAKMTNIMLSEDYEHLIEPIKEVIGVR